MREALKVNGIGRPSTRAAIIETLFKRNYIRKVRKSLEPTPTGLELIGLIHEELLKSAELTGIWEKKLREIELKKYDAATFISELKQMVTQIVQVVMADTSNRRIAITPKEEKDNAKNKQSKKKNNLKQSKSKLDKKSDNQNNNKNTTTSQDVIVGGSCPLCKKGVVIKGNAAYGCSEWRNGCTWRQPFNQH